MINYLEKIYESINPIDGDEKANEEALCFCLIQGCSTEGCVVK